MSTCSLSCSDRGDGYPAGTDPIHKFSHMGLGVTGAGVLNEFIL